MKIKQGDIIELGEHRLACGDSMDQELVNKLVGEDKIRAILTDPPYGVAYVENKKNLKQDIGKDKDIIGDELQSDDEYKVFTRKWLEVVKDHLESYNAFYIFNSDMMYPSLRLGIEEAGYYYSQGLIWIKNTIVMGRKDYLPQHELIAYGWYGRHKFERSKAKSLIPYPKPHRSKLHPTMKPVGLIRKLIPNSTKVGEWIYDPFGGSGSTLIACEHMGRKCLMIEMDPEYCEVIVKRWEKLTKKNAKRKEN